ncbi:MAG: transglycosylase SLT domain-containing protein [candidate division Zixibacteria bacterium]|nr:transglycosylase SLT domain-containing protein [candidate division Zixibacteria bacterium]
MRPLFRRQEKAYAMPTGFLEAIADRESRFRHDIVSGQLKGGVGEAGVMQLHPAYHLSSDRERIDPNISIPYAAKYLAKNYVRFGTWEEAIAAYNWGPGNVERAGVENAPAAVKEYIAWVKGRHYVEPFV